MTFPLAPVYERHGIEFKQAWAREIHPEGDAAFECIVNLEFELRARKVRDKAEIVWITNEYELGGFGTGGMHLKCGGYVVPSNLFTESLFAERGIDWITRAHVSKVEKDRVCYETLDGAQREQEFDFAMLLPV